MCVFFGWGSIVMVLIIVFVARFILRFFSAKRYEVEYHANGLGDALEEEAEDQDRWEPPNRKRTVQRLRRRVRMLWHGGNLLWSIFWLIVGILLLIFLISPSSCGGIV